MVGDEVSELGDKATEAWIFRATAFTHQKELPSSRAV